MKLRQRHLTILPLAIGAALAVPTGCSVDEPVEVIRLDDGREPDPSPSASPSASPTASPPAVDCVAVLSRLNNECNLSYVPGLAGWCRSPALEFIVCEQVLSPSTADCFLTAPCEALEAGGACPTPEPSEAREDCLRDCREALEVAYESCRVDDTVQLCEACGSRTIYAYGECRRACPE